MPETHTMAILGSMTLPDNSGEVTQEPAAVNLEANDRYPGLVYKFADTSTRDGLGFGFRVPVNYASAPRFLLVYATPATSGVLRAEIDYTSIDPGETGDPSSDQENLTESITVPGTARLLDEQAIGSPTASNFSPGDQVRGTIFRDGLEGAPIDTLADAAYMWTLIFEWQD